MHSYNLTHLKQLESEAIFIFREIASQFEKPVLLFSGGKDSIVLVRLAQGILACQASFSTDAYWHGA